MSQDTGAPTRATDFEQLPEIDQRIITAMVDDVLAAGLSITVYDGEDYAIRRSADKDAILASLAATDGDTLYFFPKDGGQRIGSVNLVYGNEPGVVISDHTDNEVMTQLLARATKIAEGYVDAG